MNYKVLGLDRRPCHGGSGQWPVPGVRRAVTGPLVACENGLHLCRERDLVWWLGPEIWEAAYEGELLECDDKIVVRTAWLVRRVDAWTERTARLFAADCAERVLALFETRHPDDLRPRAAIDAARRFARGEIAAAAGDAAWSATWAAARDAARDAAWAAARDAARDAAWAAARDAASAAARDAAWAAARAAARDAAWAAARDAASAAAWSATWAAARDAARDAAWAAARDAASAAARDAAWAAARDAATDATGAWQTERLLQYLRGEIA